MAYSPFEKKIDELTQGELYTLIEKAIPEGWHIEYKEILPRKTSHLDGLKIAKSVSAFANTRGGWLFYGIPTAKNLPTELAGISIDSSDNLLDQFTQVVSGNVNPSPIYHSKLISLENGKQILAVLVEESPTPPYITSDGSIYQRENNQSVPIRDRYIIQKLTEKAESHAESIEQFTQMEYSISKLQADNNPANLELYFFPLPFSSFRFENFDSSIFFKRVASLFGEQAKFHFGEDIHISTNFGFNSFSSSSSSIIVRPFIEQNFISQIITVEIFHNGGLKLLMPLPEFSPKEIPDKYENSKVIKYILDKYAPFNHTYEAKRVQSDLVKFSKMIDGIELLFGIATIGAYYKNLMEASGYNLGQKVGFRAKVSGIWRKFIFLENETFLSKIKDYQIPISPKDEVFIPNFFKGEHNSMYIKNEISFFHLGWKILAAIGLPDAEEISISNILTEILVHANKPKS